MIKLSKQNSKLGLIPSINLPPLITCRENCPCRNDCYGLKGRYRFSNVKTGMMNNYNSYLNNKAQYFQEISRAIDNGVVSYRYFRWHATGDIVDDEYFEGMVTLAQNLPNTSFLAFTKRFEIVNNYIKRGGQIPDNLHIVFSAWGDNFPVDNPHDFPVAHVRFHEQSNEKIPRAALNCSGDCTTCLQCWNIKHGESVVFDKH